jgi:hypothetical protein
MPKRLAMIACFVLLGLGLGGCSKCGDWIWQQGPHSCHSGMPR